MRNFKLAVQSKSYLIRLQSILDHSPDSQAGLVDRVVLAAFRIQEHAFVTESREQEPSLHILLAYLAAYCAHVDSTPGTAMNL